MQNISKMADRLNGYGRANRTGEIAIQHQVVFIRTAPLGDEDLVDNDYSSLPNHELLGMLKDPLFHHLIDAVADCYEQNVADTTAQFFNVEKFKSNYEIFRQNFRRRSLPELSEVRIEIRPAQVFSQNVYFFVKNNENIEAVEDQFRALMAENDLPAETVNLSFNATESVDLTQMYELMTVLSILLRETAKEAAFIPGRVIGNFNQITKGKSYAF